LARLFVVGLAYFVNFIFHCFFGEMAAAFIGWPDSPFQFEVGIASLGFSLVGFVAAFRSLDLCLAAILGSSVFLLGAALGHVYQMITARNFAPGNAGVIFYMDIFLFSYRFLASPSYGSRSGRDSSELDLSLRAVTMRVLDVDGREVHPAVKGYRQMIALVTARAATRAELSGLSRVSRRRPKAGVRT
jgi:hypothetical protein